MAVPKLKDEPKDRSVALIEDQLAKKFAVYRVYRYNSASIRVRVVDPVFEGLLPSQREKKVQGVLGKLPRDVRCEVTMLLLLAPGELGNLLLSHEFDNPSRSRL